MGGGGEPEALVQKKKKYLTFLDCVCNINILTLSYPVPKLPHLVQS